VIRDRTLQIQWITRRDTHEYLMDVDVADAEGAPDGNAKTNMTGSLLIAIKEKRRT